jgi:serine O-acetyltransferase
MFRTMRHDIQTIFERDPAARSVVEVLFLYPGLQALWLHRLAHALWCNDFFFLGRAVSHFSRWLTGIEIHPGAQIGPGFFIDHGMGTVIGETAEVGADVTLYHNVTLGGVSLEKVKRHPTLEDHVVVGAGAQILGPIVIGAHSRVGSNSVVVHDVPPHSVVVGVPGRVISRNGKRLQEPSADQEDLQPNRLPDPTIDMLRPLTARVVSLEASMHQMQPDDISQEADVWVAAGGGDI